MKTDEYIATLGPEDRPIFMQHVSGFAIPSRPDLGSYPGSYKHAAQALARSRGVELVDAQDVPQGRRYDLSFSSTNFTCDNPGKGLYDSTKISAERGDSIRDSLAGLVAGLAISGVGFLCNWWLAVALYAALAASISAHALGGAR